MIKNFDMKNFGLIFLFLFVSPCFAMNINLDFFKRFNDVYFEKYSDIDNAIAREKQLKHWVRSKKNLLVETQNPNWDDLGETYV